jgi:hypothetical protein
MPDPTLGQLRREWKQLCDRYGIVEAPRELDRLQTATNRKRAGLKHLNAQLTEIEAQIAVLKAELSGLDKTIGLVLREAIGELRSDRAEAWSPVPVLGFRIWDVRPDGFHGYREHWREPTLEASCPTTRTSEEVPHTDGRCGDPPCGIYAAKDVRSLIETHFSHDFERMAVGLVAMSGKVVEHEFGYRTQTARAIALAFVRGSSLFTSNNSDELRFLFQGVGLGGSWSPDSDAGSDGPKPDPVKTYAQMAKYMNHEKERQSQWTLENPNE